MNRSLSGGRRTSIVSALKPLRDSYLARILTDGRHDLLNPSPKQASPLKWRAGSELYPTLIQTQRPERRRRWRHHGGYLDDRTARHLTFSIGDQPKLIDYGLPAIIARSRPVHQLQDLDADVASFNDDMGSATAGIVWI